MRASIVVKYVSSEGLDPGEGRHRLAPHQDVTRQSREQSYTHTRSPLAERRMPSDLSPPWEESWTTLSP